MPTDSTDDPSSDPMRDEREGEDVRGQVRDVEATNQETRIRSVHQVWEDALERRTLAADMGATMEGRRYYRVGIERLLLELDSVAQRAEANNAWEDADLGTITFEVPDEITEAYQRRDLRIKEVSRAPEPVVMQLEGLQSILENDWPQRRTWTLAIATGRGAGDQISATATREPGMDVLDTAVRKLRSLLGDIGLDLELGGDYRGIGGDDAL